MSASRWAIFRKKSERPLAALYQFGVLGIIFIAVTVTICIVIISLLKGNLEAIAGLLVSILLVYWFTNIRSPTGFGGRLYRLFRDGVPLAPYGFKRNATLGYWLGIPMIYVGHLVTIPTIYLGWEVSKNPVAGLPLGIPIAFGLMFYSTGLSLVESSYRLWAERLDGAIPGDPGSSPLKPLIWSIAIATVLLVAAYSTDGYNNRPASMGVPETRANNTKDDPIPKAQMELADFLPVTNPGWTGRFESREDELEQWTRVPAAMTGTLSDGNRLNLFIFVAGESGAPIKITFKLNDAGDRLNQLVIVERSELSNGRLAIAAHGLDERAAERIRLRFLLGEKTFSLKTYEEAESGQLFLSSRYTFERKTDTD